MNKPCNKCGAPFDDGGTPQRKKCDTCRGYRHGARDARAAERREHLACSRCHSEYQGNIGRDGICPACHAEAERIKTEHDVTFVGVDGEGIAGRCENKDCECRAYVPADENDPKSLCVCGHRKAALRIPGGKVNLYHRGHRHEYVLLRCGDYAIENPNGLTIDEVLEFLYESARRYPPDAAFVIYSGGYDFTMWFRTLTEERAAQLILPEFAKERKNARRDPRTRQPFPVEYPAPKDGDWKDRAAWDESVKWQLDYLPNRKFKFRPADKNLWIKGNASDYGWVHVCDVFSFFQTSFAAAIDPAKYPPGDGPCTPEEYADIINGKQRRSHAILDDEMRRYNEMEVHVLERLMSIFNRAIVQALHVRLKKDRWFGPGQIAVNLLTQWGAPKRKDIEATLKPSVAKALIASYYGGWFEIMMHGHIPGKTYGYDINSAYPAIIRDLPCPLHGSWNYGNRKVPPALTGGQYRLAHVIVSGSDPYIGVMPHRLPVSHGIVRPHNTEGWYWQHELDAAKRAGIIDTITYLGYYTYTPCACPPPCAGVEELYNKRRTLAKVGNIKGKNTIHGIAYKLGYNSVYGKTAQSLGEPPYTNWLWASLITAGCRVMILDAIASHPEGTKAVTMVATDAVYFTSPHPTLPLSDKLGEWEESVYDGLTQIKPGVYVDDEKLEKIDRGESPVFKARGVSAKAFGPKIRSVVDQFAQFDGANWPSVTFPIEFEYVNCTQVMRWGRYNPQQPVGLQNLQQDRTANPVSGRSLWRMAGTVFEGNNKVQNSDPIEKRQECTQCRYPHDGLRLDTQHEHNHDAVYQDNGAWRTGVYEMGHMTRDGRPAPSVTYDLTMSRAAESAYKIPDATTQQGSPYDLAIEALGLG